MKLRIQYHLLILSECVLKRSGSLPIYTERSCWAAWESRSQQPAIWVLSSYHKRHPWREQRYLRYRFWSGLKWYNWGWPWTSDPPVLTCWDLGSQLSATTPVYTVQGIKPRVSQMLDKHSSSWATPSVSNSSFWHALGKEGWVRGEPRSLRVTRCPYLSRTEGVPRTCRAQC